MTDTNFLDRDPLRMAELNRMKLLATGLLILMAVVYMTSAYFEHQLAWVGYINATSEAAMIGAIADWFAVTALFKHPLGLQIPHTAIIPARKNDIAEQFGRFVQSNFLSEAVITEKIRSMNLSRRVAAWIIEPENAHAVANQVTAGLAGVVKVINDDDIQQMIEKKRRGENPFNLFCTNDRRSAVLYHFRSQTAGAVRRRGQDGSLYAGRQ